MSRTVVLAGLLGLAISGPAPAELASPAGPPKRPPSVGSAVAAVRYSLPLAADVLRGFDPPAGPYAAGHRGVDLAATAGSPVFAAASGRVGFAGSVAGRGIVVLVHPDGVRTEYEPVVPVVRPGRHVSRGELIATVSGRHGDCPPGQCLHWGARRASAYLDPLTLLRPLGPVRLLPWPEE